MDNSDIPRSTISGDLPIRSAPRTQEEDPEKEPDVTQAPVKNAQVENAVHEPPHLKPNPAETTLKLDEAVAAVIGPQLVAQMQKKKKRKRGPKGKRGVVSMNDYGGLVTKINLYYDDRASQLDLKNGVLMDR